MKARLLSRLHALDLVEALDGLLVHQVAAEPVDGVGRVADDAALLEHLDRALHLARLGVLWVDRQQHVRASDEPRRRDRSVLERFGAADDFHQLRGDRGLARAVVLRA